MKAYIKRSLLTILCGYLLAQIILTLLPSGTARADQLSCKELAGSWSASKKLDTATEYEVIWASGQFFGYVAGFFDRTFDLQVPLTEAELRTYNLYKTAARVGEWLDENPQYWRISVTAHDCVYKAVASWG